MTPTRNPDKRRHATMACVACRKSKCDGELPSCSNCMSKDRECQYQSFDRRKLPLRIAVELLSRRVDQLSKFIHERGLDPPPMPDEMDSTLRKILKALGMAEQVTGAPEINRNRVESLYSAPTDSDVDIPAGGLRDNGTDDAPYTAPDADSGTGTHPLTASTSSATMPDELSCITLEGRQLSVIEDSSADGVNVCNWDLNFWTSASLTSSDLREMFRFPSNNALGMSFDDQTIPLTGALSDNDSARVESISDIECLIDEISDRVGTLKIGPGGKTRFCGPTSAFNLVDMSLSEDYKPQQRIRNYDVGADRDIPASLESHLTNLYFSWQDPLFHVVDRAMYEDAKVKWHNLEETPFYSEALRNAICALGSAFESRFHPSFVTFPKTMVDFFADRAKLLLEMELDSPSVATVQAAVILSSHEVGNGKDTRGWLYSGMALRLAFDLALHLDMTSYVSMRNISAADADLRRTVFWAAYIVDHQLGFHLGRPSRTTMEDVTVGKPQGNEYDFAGRLWTPYEVPTLSNGPGLLDCTEAVNQNLVSLCELMAPCGYILYGTSNISKGDLQELNAKIVAKLRQWKATLPPILQINLDDFTSPYLPHVLLLHMQYHQNIIYAHRPWMSKSQLQPQPPKGPGHAHAREMCIQSAVSISKILSMYESRYSLRNINVRAVSITSSAILLLLFAAVSNYSSPSQSDIARYLSTCFRALDEFSISWQNAYSAKNLLVNLQYQWELRTRHSGIPQLVDTAPYLPRKRQRASNELSRMAPAQQDRKLQMDIEGCIFEAEDGIMSCNHQHNPVELVSDSMGFEHD